MEKALKILQDLQRDRDSRGFIYSFSQRMEFLAQFISSDLEDVITALDEGIDRISELEGEVSDLNVNIEEFIKQINDLEREQL